MPDNRYFRILSIDGGGIRGIIPATVLLRLESELQRKHNDATLKIGDCFDLIAGTSTGGILALLFLTPDDNNPSRAKYSVQQALNLYVEHGHEIFDESLRHKIGSVDGILEEKYPAAALESLLAQHFGDTILSKLLRACLITSFDTQNYRPVFFTQHDASGVTDYFARDVARATSAAPTYFQPALPQSLDKSVAPVPMIDGGVFANNPTACALVEALKIADRTSNDSQSAPSAFSKATSPATIAMLSLGTGKQPHSITFATSDRWGLAGWARPVIDILMEGSAETVDYQMQVLFSSTGVADNYLRIDGAFNDLANKLVIPGLDAAMDNASAQNVKLLQAFGNQLVENSSAEITNFVNRFL